MFLCYGENVREYFMLLIYFGKSKAYKTPVARDKAQGSALSCLWARDISRCTLRVFQQIIQRVNAKLAVFSLWDSFL